MLANAFDCPVGKAGQVTQVLLLKLVVPVPALEYCVERDAHNARPHSLIIRPALRHTAYRSQWSADQLELNLIAVWLTSTDQFAVRELLGQGFVKEAAYSEKGPGRDGKKVDRQHRVWQGGAGRSRGMGRPARSYL
jgi:hypothetical protein